ncbi:hypothetical protein BIY23_03835 [Wolbachia pipientis]|uniref:Uncharacterized protein n=1 Tax=Wolbachia pipientis TaxID=955 RepID=A0A1E7QJ66_WOLPI|nr:hypothetical protein [Wolbachia pipientis]OEY86522.1 hypothetical protein BIY23_03835 [Wolbachia pipientis]
MDNANGSQKKQYCGDKNHKREKTEESYVTKLSPNFGKLLTDDREDSLALAFPSSSSSNHSQYGFEHKNFDENAGEFLSASHKFPSKKRYDRADQNFIPGVYTAKGSIVKTSLSSFFDNSSNCREERDNTVIQQSHNRNIDEQKSSSQATREINASTTNISNIEVASAFSKNNSQGRE